MLFNNLPPSKLSFRDKDINYFNKYLNKTEDIFVYFNIDKIEWYKQHSFLQERKISQILLEIVIKELNGDWIPDFSNTKQKKYYNCFKLENGEFVFDGTSYYWRNMNVPSALYLKSEGLAKYCKDNFIDLYKSIYLD